jgi:hypothetical protein
VQIDLDTEKGAKTVLIGATSDGSYRLESHQGGNVNVRQLLQGELFSVEAVVGQPLSGLQPNPSVGRRITFGANTVKRVVLLGHRGFDPLPPPITPAPAPTSAPTVRAVASVPTGAARGRVRTPAIGTATVEKFDPTGLTELAAASIADPRRQVDFLEKALTHPRDLSAWLHSVGPGARGRTVVARALLDVQQAIVGECTTRAAELGSLGLPFTELVTTIQQIAPGLAGKGDAVAPAIPGL